MIATHARNLTLLNTDQVILTDTAGSNAPPEVRFHWAGAGRDADSNQSATSGPRAIRQEHLPLVLERLKEAWSRESGEEFENEEEIRTRVVQEPPLIKRISEGRGGSPAGRCGGWVAMSNSAFVNTLNRWHLESFMYRSEGDEVHSQYKKLNSYDS